MDQSRAVTDGLERQAGTEIVLVAERHAECANDVVDRLVAAAEMAVVHGRREILEIDPAGHDQRARKDAFQTRAVRIDDRIVFVQENLSLERGVAAPMTRCDEQAGVAGQSPFWTHLRPVGAPRPDRRHRIRRRRCIQESSPPGRIPAAGLLQGRPQRVHQGSMPGRHGIDIEKLDLVRGRVVQAGDEEGIRGNRDASAGERVAHGRVVEKRRRNAGVDIARKAAAGAAIEPRCVGIIGRRAPVSAEEHEPRARPIESEAGKDAGSQLHLLLEGERRGE